MQVVQVGVNCYNFDIGQFEDFFVKFDQVFVYDVFLQVVEFNYDGYVVYFVLLLSFFR